MPNMPSGVKGKWAKSRGSTNRMSFRDEKGKRVSRASLKAAFQKTYAKQAFQDMGQSAYIAQLPAKRQAQILRQKQTQRRLRKGGKRRAA